MTKSKNTDINPEYSIKREMKSRARAERELLFPEVYQIKSDILTTTRKVVVDLLTMIAKNSDPKQALANSPKLHQRALLIKEEYVRTRRTG